MSIKYVFFFMVFVCVVVSANAQLPQFPIPFPFPLPFQPSPGIPGLPDVAKCWFSVMDIPGCIKENYTSILTGQFGHVGPSCCKAFLEAEANCLPKLPFNPLFPLKEQFSANAQLPQFPIPFPFPLPFQPSPGIPGLPDVAKCWSSVMDIPGCIIEIYTSILTGKFGHVGPSCCKAFLEAEANCLPKLPFNPLFPLKEQCSRIAKAAPPTTK
ncbi:unnamed protein product [Brassica napus]|uniref:(rape) hypothetical protein n=1 Tax=Brassica napus TaxID=3708 RepID=A0A816ZSY0_BRANA|nr:unnamed protein product [Brassica napus]